MRILDTNIYLDLVTADPKWLGWSQNQFKIAASEGPIAINPIIYAELAAVFDSQGALDHFLRPALFRRLALPFEAGFRASRAFLAYRKAGGARLTPVPDFYIGAHAEFAGLTLVTRDNARYRTYFPKVTLISPDK